MENFLLVLLAEMAELEKRQRTERIRKLKQLRDCSNPFSSSEEVFMKNFRLTKSLCQKLIEDLQPHDIQRTTLPLEIRVLTALNFFGHGSYQQCVGNNWVLPMSQPSVSRTLHKVAELIIKVKGVVIKFPQTPEELSAIKTGFYRSFGIKCTIGAIDCTHVAIVSPSANDPSRPLNMYMNRKGYYSINVEATCDHQLSFTSMNAKFPGACHDSGIWTTSPVRTQLMRSYTTLQDSWLLGDQGYPLEPWLLTPFAEPHGAKEIKYNKLHAKSRNTIERAFGVLKIRFRCLSKQRVLYYSHERAANIIYACAILHNIMLTSGVETDIDQNEEEPVVELDNGEAIALTQNLREGERVRSRYVSSL